VCLNTPLLHCNSFHYPCRNVPAELSWLAGYILDYRRLLVPVLISPDVTKASVSVKSVTDNRNRRHDINVH